MAGPHRAELEALLGALTGPGSQPEGPDDAKLDYMVMPEEMRVFSMASIPSDASGHEGGMAAGEAILSALTRVAAGGKEESVDLSGLGAGDLGFVDQLLGEGEVSVVLGAEYQAQESVLAGVWRVRQTSSDGTRLSDRVDIGAFPAGFLGATLARAKPEATLPEQAIEGVFNAPALIAEINDHIPGTALRDGPHVINLSLLPHTEGDLTFLESALGQGDLIILSRGYGNCRIRSTGTRHCWWVRYFNSQDTLILNAIEISPLPEVAQAAPEDLADSAERLAEIMDTYR